MPSKNTKKEEKNDLPEISSFQELNLAPKLLETIEELGWKDPTPIQAKAIPITMEGKDVMGVAQTGTGKTGAYLLPILQKLREPGEGIRALILLPTRELALQVERELDKLAPAMGLRHTVVYGGAPIGTQRIAIRKGVDILVATPGRLLDLTRHVVFHWGKLDFLVLDEADRMLDMGFIPDVEKIMSKLPMGRQTLLFTATLEPSIKKLAENYMLFPKEVSVGYNRTVAEGITQWVYPVRRDQKKDLLMQLMDELDIKSAIIFCATKARTDQVGRALKRRNYNLGVLHSDRSQAAREETLQKFRNNEITYLVATDVASRGLDVTGVTHVVNFDVPQQPDDYIHRVGRTARAEARGDAITLVSRDESKAIKNIEEWLGYDLEQSVLADFPYKGGPPVGTKTTTKKTKVAEPEEEKPAEKERRPARERKRREEKPVEKKVQETKSEDKEAEKKSPPKRQPSRRKPKKEEPLVRTFQTDRGEAKVFSLEHPEVREKIKNTRHKRELQERENIHELIRKNERARNKW